MIVITAPTGNIGGQVLRTVLAGTEEPVRVVVRDPGRLSDDIRDRVETVQGSHGDPQVIDKALRGADALFWLLPTDHRAPTLTAAYSGFTRPASEAIRTHGVGHVVDVTALGRGTAQAGRAGHVTASLAMDDLLTETGAAFRGVACPSFMDNMARQIRTIKEQGVFFDVLGPDHAMPVVASRDIAAAASRLLLDRAWNGQEEVHLLGPEDLSGNDMAAVMSDVLRTPVHCRQVSAEAYKEQVTEHGMSEAMAQGLVDMIVAKGQGLDLGITRTPEHAIDTPTTFRQWCEEALRPAVQAG